jgi:hypothetical protein
VGAPGQETTRYTWTYTTQTFECGDASCTGGEVLFNVDNNIVAVAPTACIMRHESTARLPK